MDANTCQAPGQDRGGRFQGSGKTWRVGLKESTFNTPGNETSLRAKERGPSLEKKI